MQLPRGTWLFLVVIGFDMLGVFSHVARAQTVDRVAEFRKIAQDFRMQSDVLSREAEKRKTPFAGTAFNEFGSQEAFCGSLAYLLGKDGIFKRLTTLDAPTLKPRMRDQDLNVLSLEVRMYETRAYAAERALSLSKREQSELWNLQCVRQHKIGEEQAVGRIAPQAAFDVRGDQLHVLGDIEVGFFERFKKALSESKNVKVVQLGSGGGSVRDAMLSGLLIRGLGLATSLVSDCYSACPLIFLGGKERVVYAPYPRLGFHQASQNGQALPPAHEIYDAVRRYADSMGADGRYFVSLMQNASPAGMHYPDAWDLCGVGITTWVQRGC